jgi:hypothetical protein
MKSAVHVLGEDLEGGKALIEPEKITYWSHKRVADPANYWQAALGALPNTLTSQAKAVGDKLGSRFKFLEEVDGGKALIDPDKITYWSHGRVADPAKYAPAALAAVPPALEDIGLGIVNPRSKPDIALPSLPASPAPLVLAPSAPPLKAARNYSRSEYSDYRSSDISFHSSHATMSSGQKRPQPDMRNAVYSPYL